MGFTSLAHLIDIDWLCAAFPRTRKDGATGVDGQTWDDYAKNLEANLQSLLDRAKSGMFTHESDARRVLEVLPKHFDRYKIHASSR
jgi:retron-type reverse transcriptase